MFLKTKTHRNRDGSLRQYLQLVKSTRVNGKPRHSVLLQLGRVDPKQPNNELDQVIETLLKISERFTLLDLEKNLKADWSKIYGPHLIFRRIWKESGLEDVLQMEFKDSQTEFSIVEAIFNMVLNRLSEPCSKRGLDLWQKNHYGISTFDPHCYYRALDYLIERKDSIELGVFHKMQSLFCQNIDVVMFDTTSLVYFGEEDPEVKKLRAERSRKKLKKKGNATQKAEHQEPPPLLARGFSKDHRSDLPQVVVGVLMSQDGIPLGHEVFPGNTNDLACFKKVIDQISEKFKIKRVVLVGDRGMICPANIEYLNSKHYEYILGYRMRTIPKEDRHWILSKADLKKTKADLQWKEVSFQDQRLLVCYNPERAKLDAEKREDILDRIRARIKNGSILSVVDNTNYKKFLKIEGKLPKLNPEAVERDMLYDGMYVLTSNTKLKAAQIIDSYKDLWQVEHAFRNLKSELEVGPIFHWKDPRIRSHVMVCFLALILRTLLSKKLNAFVQAQAKTKAQSKAKKMDAAPRPISYTEVLQDISALHAIGLQIKNQSVILRTELQPQASLAFQALGMSPPKRILSSHDIRAVVPRAHS